MQSAKANLALKRVPGIIYTDKGYQLAGNGKAAKLLIDGIETTETELGKIMAGDIEKVEVRRIGLNDEASSGEINVILKRNRANLLKRRNSSRHTAIQSRVQLITFCYLSFRKD